MKKFIKSMFTAIIYCIKTPLQFLNILEHDGKKVSLSNIMIICLTVKIMLMPVLDWFAIAALLTVVINYGYKRHVNSKVKVVEETESANLITAKDLKAINDKIKTIENLVGFKKLR